MSRDATFQVFNFLIQLLQIFCPSNPLTFKQAYRTARDTEPSFGVFPVRGDENTFRIIRKIAQGSVGQVNVIEDMANEFLVFGIVFNDFRSRGGIVKELNRGR